MPASVKVTGLQELQNALILLEGDSTSIAKGLKSAADIVAVAARGKAGGFSSRAAGTIRPGASVKTAYVVGGNAQLPWYGWADFGSRNPVSGNPRSMGPWAHSGKGPRDGRFIYPAIESRSPQVAEAVATAIADAMRRAGWR